MVKYVSLYNINSNNYNKPMNKKNIYEQTIEKVLKRAEKEIDSNSYYRPIEEDVLNSINGKSLKFKIVQDEENLSKHFFEAVITDKNTATDLTRPLAYGDRETIIQYLKNPDVLKNIMGHIKQMEQD